MAKIRFHYSGVPSLGLDYQQLELLIDQIFQHEKIGYHSISVIFTTDEELLNMNRKFLDHDDYTDVLTFTMNQVGKRVMGEIYISIDRVKENACLFRVPVADEIIRVVIHGNLHLCGYTDHNAEFKADMTSRENYYLNMYKSQDRSTWNIKKL